MKHFSECPRCAAKRNLLEVFRCADCRDDYCETCVRVAGKTAGRCPDCDTPGRFVGVVGEQTDD
jgi:hypothetical protein